ncbi:MAG: hypothetical protein JO069_02570 [Verrucomicrobia bacterium]|nr:hypothetical protein [Verrucomicrobiota bacterium]
MGSVAKIIELRQILAQRFPPQQPATSPATFIPTSVPGFDQALGGGLPRGAITQLVAPLPSSGSTLVLREVIYALQRRALLVALVDGANCFEPIATADHFLWVRCRRAAEAVKAVDLLLRDGNIPLTFLDLRQNRAVELRKLPVQTWYRFQRLTEESQTTLLLLTRYPMVPCAGLTLHVHSALALDDLGIFSSDLIGSLRFEVQQMRRRQGIKQPAVYATGA